MSICKPTSTAQRRYRRRFFPMMALYVAAVFGASWLFRYHPPQGAVRYLLAAAPALPIIGVLVILGLYLIEETDEFVRMKQVSAMLAGLGVTLAICTTWGFLESYASTPHLPLYLVFAIWCVAWSVSLGVISWRYR